MKYFLAVLFLLMSVSAHAQLTGVPKSITALKSEFQPCSIQSKANGCIGPQQWQDFIASYGARTVQSVMEFGAKGDGTTDDTTSIQTCYTTLHTLTNNTGLGGACYFPPGSYKITATITGSRDVSTYCQDPSSTVIFAGTGFPASNPMFRIDSPADSNNSGKIEHLTAIENCFFDAKNIAEGIYAQSFQENGVIENVAVFNWVDYGIKLTSNSPGSDVPENWHISDCWIVGGTGTLSSAIGIDLIGATGSNKLERCTIQGNGGGVTIAKDVAVDGGSQVFLDSLHMEGATVGIEVINGFATIIGPTGNATLPTMVQFDAGSTRGVCYEGYGQGSAVEVQDNTLGTSIQTNCRFYVSQSFSLFTQWSGAGKPAIFMICDSYASNGNTDCLSINNNNYSVNLWGVTDEGAEHRSNASGITAHATGGQASATVLTSDINEIDTVANNNDSVMLSAYTCVLGMERIVANTQSNSVQVFGHGSDTINAAASGTGVALAGGKTGRWACASSGKWFGGTLN